MNSNKKYKELDAEGIAETVNDTFETLRHRAAETLSEARSYGEEAISNVSKVAAKNAKQATKFVKQHSTEAVIASFFIGWVVGAIVCRRKGE